MIGKIISVDGRKIEIELSEAFNQNYLKLLADGKENFVDVTALDNRGISPKQNALSHALIGDVAVWQGEPVIKATELDLKREYLFNTNIFFEHHTATKSDAKKWIEFLIKFIHLNNVPLPKLYSYLLRQTAWFYYSLKYRHCCICGKHADVAHYEAVGMGRNRKKLIIAIFDLRHCVESTT